MNTTPAFIPVKKKNKQTQKETANHKRKNMEDEDDLPNSLKEYVSDALNRVEEHQIPELEVELNRLIIEAQQQNRLTQIDWNERNLPSICGDIHNPRSAKKQKVKKSQLVDIVLTSEEVKKRELRAMRFQNEEPVPIKPKKKNIVPIFWGGQEEVDVNKVMEGTSHDLEKAYFRLTSAADPTKVRPLAVLRKAFKMLRKKWKEEANYNYICEQFKSMRQDLTVQQIRNEFTVRVYETHARIALEKGDLGEYNQCQTQLKYLYEQGIEGSADEFLAYRILYMIFSQNQSDINAMLEEMCNTNDHSECVRHALMVRSSLAKKNYHRFFRLYEEAPNMGGYLMDQFVDRERIEALIVICKAYKMGLSLSYIATELSFDSIDYLIEFLKQHKLKQAMQYKERILDTKVALPILLKQSEYTRVINL
ncbi:SAC3/GANP/Nin1/mts3/eIF-3 p25 family-domain-containing protein [Pilobolus umbonatus]|nr:SAC3/GANP/Nin1/mts3/eIF-3 p25 family-domain-containing protein [Pilobolus umbonatus]